MALQKKYDLEGQILKVNTDNYLKANCISLGPQDRSFMNHVVCITKMHIKKEAVNHYLHVIAGDATFVRNVIGGG